VLPDRIDDEALEDLLDQRFECGRGAMRTRDATPAEIGVVLRSLTTTLGRLVARSADPVDDETLGHLAPRIAVLVEQIGELRVALAWVTEHRSLAPAS
jgi:hypothetical protein